MPSRRFNPTSLVARQLKAEQRRVRHIRLNKQLSRARKRLGEAASAPPAPTLQPAIEETLAQLQEKEGSGDKGSRRQLRATEPPARPPKADPMRRALDRRQAREQQMREEAEERERQVQAREAAKAKQRALREKLHKKLTATTKRGQPRLANHIEAMLQKFQREQK